MEIDFNKLSPMMRRYFEMKEEYPDCLLFFRLGDFYEMFFKDAEIASSILDLTLTGRNCGLEERAPMCGVPFHSVDSYIRKLIEAGQRVAICEQLSDPATTKGMLERDVVRVISSGTVMEEEILDEKESNYIASIYTDDKGFGLAWADISTGEFNVIQYENVDFYNRLGNLLSAIEPSEIISNEAFTSKYQGVNYFISTEKRPRCYQDFAYNVSVATKKLCYALKVSSLQSFELDDQERAVSAAGGLMEYLNQTQKRALSQIRTINLIRDKSYMVLDGATRRNLELTSRARDGRRQGSLLSVIDKTKTSIGARTIRRFVEQPLQEADKINQRLDAVDELVQDKVTRDKLVTALSGARDLERLAGRVAYGNASPKDLYSIAETLAIVPALKESLKGKKSHLLKTLNNTLDALPHVASEIFAALNPDKIASYKLGGYIKKGYDSELDEYSDIDKSAIDWLEDLEAREREETGIKTLKVHFNKVFGYYIEVSKSFIDKVPYRYQRRQTLVNGERYITDELKEIEVRVLSAEEKVTALENKIFANLKEICFAELVALQNTAKAIGYLDAILSFASVAVSNRYTKPVINAKTKSIRIKNGRHPVVERLVDRGSYVPNDTVLDTSENRTMVITGPNMAGKSTYMRQVAIMVLMAHIGCFVPADEAEISITDRIFTRIGASDDLFGGQSTFMVEMIEVATILNYATSSSLLILDEIGRGTSTFDGLSIAWAVLEYITKSIKAKTLFATHFHELTELEDLEGVKNYRVLVSEHNDTIIFLHKITRGGASRSFGIEVASLAGVLKPVVEHARRIMASLEEDAKNRDTNSIMLSSNRGTKTAQVSLFDVQQSKIEEEIKALNVDTLTPLQVLTILSELNKRLNENN
ncbi:MAG: DNA mismatch repair protein MutS [Clostridia bacterium]|nr:DNA mismatch repair protein MutS [Clostridia bacterium]